MDRAVQSHVGEIEVQGNENAFLRGAPGLCLVDPVECGSGTAIAQQHAGVGQGLSGLVLSEADQTVVHTAGPSRSILR